MVTYVYNHATIGDGLAALSSIREPDVNLSIARNVVDPETVAYLHDIDWQEHFQSAWSAAPPPPGREGICNHNCFACPLMPFHGDRMVIKPADFGVFNVADTQEVIRAGLHAFPKNSGLVALEQTIIDAIKGFAHAAGAEKIRSDLIAKFDAGSSAWHQDGNVHTRGLITLMGSGTYWRPNDTVAAEEWGGNVRLDERGKRTNGYGLFGTFMERAHQVETGDMMVFKGGLASEQPLIHAEPTHPVTKSERAMRLLLTMDKV